MSEGHASFMQALARAGGVAYRVYQPGDEGQVLVLLNTVFARPRGLSRWRWEYLENPTTRLDIILAEHGTRLIGHTAGVPLLLQCDGAGFPATRVQNVCVHPDFRRRGIFQRLLEEFSTHLRAHGVERVYAFPNDNSLPGFLSTGAYEHVLDVPSYTLALERLGAAPVRVYLELEDAPSFRDGDVAFLQRRLEHFRFYNPRGKDYLRWRYHPASGLRYRLLRAFDGGELVGLAVAKLYVEGRSIDLLEFVFQPEEGLLRAALCALAESFRAERPLAFNLWSLEHFPLHALIRRLCFQADTRVTHFISGAPSLKAPAPLPPEAYYLSMGDSDVY